MASKTEICNLALSHLGVSKEIANIDTEKSASALACRRFYESARDEIFRDFNWPFATNYIALELIEENPNTDWAFSYRYPSDCTRIRKILSGLRNDSRQSRVSYEIARDDTARLIFTDERDAVIKFTKKTTTESFYPQDFVMALALLLAAYIAPRLTAGDPFKVGERAFNLYLLSKQKAEAGSFNEQQNDENVESEFVRARDVPDSSGGNRQTFNEFIT